MNEITVKVTEEKRLEKMRMTQHFGDGEMGDIKFSASFALPTFALIVEIGDRQFIVDQRDIIQAIIEKAK